MTPLTAPRAIPLHAPPPPHAHPPPGRTPGRWRWWSRAPAARRRTRPAAARWPPGQSRWRGCRSWPAAAGGGACREVVGSSANGAACGTVLSPGSGVLMGNGEALAMRLPAPPALPLLRLPTVDPLVHSAAPWPPWPTPLTPVSSSDMSPSASSSSFTACRVQQGAAGGRHEGRGRAHGAHAAVCVCVRAHAASAPGACVCGAGRSMRRHPGNAAGSKTMPGLSSFFWREKDRLQQHKWNDSQRAQSALCPVRRLGNALLVVGRQRQLTSRIPRHKCPSWRVYGGSVHKFRCCRGGGAVGERACAHLPGR